MEKENKELSQLLGKINKTNNYQEEEYYKLFIKKEIDRLKKQLQDFNSNNTINQSNYIYEKNYTKESNITNDKSEKTLSYYDENQLVNNTGGNYNNKKFVNKVHNLIKKNELFSKNNFEKNQNLNNNDIGINQNNHFEMNNNFKVKNKLNYGIINNNYKSQRGGSKKRK